MGACKGKLVAKCVSQTSPIRCAAFELDGSRIVTVPNGNTALVSDIFGAGAKGMGDYATRRIAGRWTKYKSTEVTTDLGLETTPGSGHGKKL